LEELYLCDNKFNPKNFPNIINNLKTYIKKLEI